MLELNAAEEELNKERESDRDWDNSKCIDELEQRLYADKAPELLIGRLMFFRFYDSKKYYNRVCEIKKDCEGRLVREPIIKPVY